MANIVGLVTAQMKSVCDGLGAGIKSLLMDSETISTISIACPQSALMRQAPHLHTPVFVSHLKSNLLMEDGAYSVIISNDSFGWDEFDFGHDFQKTMHDKI